MSYEKKHNDVYIFQCAVIKIAEITIMSFLHLNYNISWYKTGTRFLWVWLSEYTCLWIYHWILLGWKRNFKKWICPLPSLKLALMSSLILFKIGWGGLHARLRVKLRFWAFALSVSLASFERLQLFWSFVMVGFCLVGLCQLLNLMRFSSRVLSV